MDYLMGGRVTFDHEGCCSTEQHNAAHKKFSYICGLTKIRTRDDRVIESQDPYTLERRDYLLLRILPLLTYGLLSVCLLFYCFLTRLVNVEEAVACLRYRGEPRETSLSISGL
jgi:hypothetical protein